MPDELSLAYEAFSLLFFLFARDSHVIGEITVRRFRQENTRKSALIGDLGAI